MHKITLVVAVLSLVACATSPDIESPRPLRDQVEGKWAWKKSKCQSESYTHSFSDDGQFLVVDAQVVQRLVKGGKEWMRLNYRILDENTSALRMVIDGEERATSDGKPVVWDLVMLSNTKFCWHRADWRKHECTDHLVRC